MYVYWMYKVRYIRAISSSLVQHGCHCAWSSCNICTLYLLQFYRPGYVVQLDDETHYLAILTSLHIAPTPGAGNMPCMILQGRRRDLQLHRPPHNCNASLLYIRGFHPPGARRLSRAHSRTIKIPNVLFQETAGTTQLARSVKAQCYSKQQMHSLPCASCAKPGATEGLHKILPRWCASLNLSQSLPTSLAM